MDDIHRKKKDDTVKLCFTTYAQKSSGDLKPKMILQCNARIIFLFYNIDSPHIWKILNNNPF